MNDERFDKLIEHLGEEAVPQARFEAAKERVWQRLQASPSAACDELQGDLAAYASRTIGAARRLLIEDHLSRCVACRRQLGELRGATRVRPMQPIRRRRVPTWARVAAAASVVLAVLYVGSGPLDSMLTSGPRATVVEISGTLYKPSGATMAAGAEIGEGELVRTAAGARALLRLRDGSEIEMNQRTELAISAARSGATIHLERGDVIVAATEQGQDRLRVVTRDSIAAVKGTVFAVSSGTAGSLVSVVEGEVAVSQAGAEQLVTAGQQVATTSALEGGSVAQAVSWSAEANDYRALLSEFSRIASEVAASTRGMRREATMVDYLPRNVDAYFAIPNLDGAIADALAILDARAPNSQVLGKWWFSEEGREMRAALDQMQQVTALLGDELVVVMIAAAEPRPLFLAEIKPGAGEQVAALIAEMMDDDGDALPVRIDDTLLMMADSPAHLALFAAELGAGSGSEFAAELRQRYRRGVGWLAAVDVATFSDAVVIEDAVSRLLGLSSMRYLFVEQRSDSGNVASEATLSFRGDRDGIASWIAAPGGIGAVEYLSADAVAAIAGSTTDPSTAFDELATLLGTEAAFAANVGAFRADTGVDLRDDIFASLGTDFAIAIDGLALRELAWVAVAEVINPGALDHAMGRLVDALNANLGDYGTTTFTEETINGRTWRRLSGGDASTGWVWTYDRGYMVVSSSEAAALRAIATRDASASLVRTTRFQRLIPGGDGVHNSGFLWGDLSTVHALLAAIWQETLPADLTSEPVLITLTGDDDSMRWASRARFTSLLFEGMRLLNE